MTQAAAGIVVDADTCLPAEVAERLGLTLAPPNLPVLLERESIPRLALEAGRLDGAFAADACRALAARGFREAIYVALGDEYGHAADGVAMARSAPLRIHAVETGQALMGAGWAAVAAAEALRAGASAETAARRARAVAETAEVLLYLDHPEIADVGGSGGLGTPVPLVARARGAAFSLVAATPRREQGLIALRDRFVADVSTGDGALRVAVHHAAAAAAARAMATVARRAGAREVLIAPLTRHAATRLGPGMVGVAWFRDPAFAG